MLCNRFKQAECCSIMALPSADGGGAKWFHLRAIVAAMVLLESLTSAAMVPLETHISPAMVLLESHSRSAMVSLNIIMMN